MDPATAGGFSQEQFREACAELQQPALAGADWQLLVETSGISIYRLLDQVAAGLQDRSGPTSLRGPRGRSLGTQARLLALGGASAGAVPPADFVLCWELELGGH